MTTQPKDTITTFRLDRESIDDVMAKIQELIHEGNVRRAVVKNATGATVIEVPLAVGIVGAALLPVWAAIAAIAALAADFTIEFERRTDDPGAEVK